MVKKGILSVILVGAMLGCDSKDTHIEGNDKNEPLAITTTEPAQVVEATPEKSSKNDRATKKITSEEFKAKVFDYSTNKNWIYAGDKPCIVDFYADWCGPCKMLAPTLEKIAKQYEGKIHVYKINIDEQEEVARVFGISSIPTLLLCPKNGGPQATQGLVKEAELKKAVEEFLLK